jgi:hypothetical protein
MAKKAEAKTARRHQRNQAQELTDQKQKIHNQKVEIAKLKRSLKEAARD